MATRPPEPGSASALNGAPAVGSPVPAVPAVPATPLPLPLLLDEAMRWVRRYGRAIYPPIAVPAAVLSAGLAALQTVWQPPDAPVPADPLQSLARLYAMLAVSLPFSLLIGLLYSAMIVAAVDAVAGRTVDVGRALRFVVRPAVLGTQLLVFLCVIAAAVLCCVVPAFYVWPLLAMTLPAMADEGVTGTAALRRSAELTRHNPRRRWLASPIVKILAVVLVTSAMSVLVSMVLQLPVAVVQGVALMRRAASGEDVPGWISTFSWLQVPLRCLASLAVSAVAVYSSFAMALLFFDLRARREGGDLWRAIAGMTGAAAPAAGGPPP
ncbi:MAG TPA: hypothetical protein VMW75_08720 [Thermoanaerobaculia bacterium]|nr:hypothetical protein [Thermoanaerobaculia bacterium]